MTASPQAAVHQGFSRNPTILANIKRAAPEAVVWATIGAAALAVTFPLFLHLGDRLPGAPGDNLYFFWELWWFKRALLELHISPLVNPEVYYPVGLELARDEITAANTVIGLPLTALFGAAITYNLLILASFLLSGYAVYRFAFEVTGNRWAGLVSGVAFAIAPYRMAHLAGHLNLMTTQWLVLTLLFLERAFRNRRKREGALAGICFGLNALAAWYYLYIGTIAVIIYVIVRSWPWKKVLRDRRLWQGALAFIIFAVLLITPFAIPYLQLRGGGELQRTFADLDAWSASPSDFLQPSPLHPLWGDFLRHALPLQWRAWVERTLSLGWIVLLLAGIGAWVERRNRIAQTFVALALVSFLIALGPTLHWDGVRVEYPLPRVAREFTSGIGLPSMLDKWLDPSLGAVVREGRGFVPLPAMLLYVTVPLTSSMRAILRFGVVTILSSTILAGYGIAFLLRRVHHRPRAQAITALALGLAIVFEFWSVYPAGITAWTPVAPRPVDEWLAAQPEQAVIVEYPIMENVSARAMLHQTFNHQRMVLGGLPPSFKMPLLTERADRIRSFPSAEAVGALREWNTRYVLVTPAEFTEEDWQSFGARLAQLSELRLVNELGAVRVYEIR